MALGFYYAEIETRGVGHIPREGPLLLMANHRISLIDPLLMISQTNRAVRFIANAPLFDAFFLSFELASQLGPALRDSTV